MMQMIQNEITWFLSLEKAEKLGVLGFVLSSLFILIWVVRAFIALIRALAKPKMKIDFKIKDVDLQSFRKRNFVTFDLYVQNMGRKPIEISRAGLVLADGSERTLFSEPRVVKMPDVSLLQPGEQAFFNDCDLYYCLNERPPFYKRITGLFVDAKGYQRYSQKFDIPAVMNDQSVREILTDKKGANGF